MNATRAPGVHRDFIRFGHAPPMSTPQPENPPLDQRSDLRCCDLEVRGAREQWRAIRWALFVFPAIRDVQPTDDPDIVRVLHESARPYPHVWAVELAQRGFDVPTPAAPHSQEERNGTPKRTAVHPPASAAAPDALAVVSPPA